MIHLRVSLALGLLLAAEVVGAAELESSAGAWAGAASAAPDQAEPTGQVYRDRVQPHWLEGNTRFWYRLRVADGAYQFILVDAEKGVREPAFDHERLAQALRAAGVPEARAEALPLSTIEFTNGTVRFRAGAKAWSCDLESYHLQTLAPSNAPASFLRPAGDTPHASRRTGEETTVTFVNRTEEEAQLFWIDPEGQRQPYGALHAGERREQHTFGGHVWLVTDAAGKSLGVVEAQDTPTEAEITREGLRTTEYSPRPARGARRAAPHASASSPDGRWRVEIKAYNLVLREVASGVATPLSTNGTAEDGYAERVFWSPDSKRLVALRTAKGEDHEVFVIESSPKDQLQPKLQSYPYLKPGDRIPSTKPHLFEVASAREAPIEDGLFPNPWSISELRWSRDSSRFTFLYNQRGHQVLRIVAVAAGTGKTMAIVDEHSPTFIDYSGKEFSDYLEDAGEIIWMSERDGWNHLYLYDALSGQVKNQITRGPWVVRGVERVDKERRQIWFRAGGVRPGQDPYYIHYCRVNFDGTGLVVLTEGDGTHTAQFSPDYRFFIDTWSRVDLAPVTELRRGDDGGLVCHLETADIQELKAAGWRPPQRFVAKGRDGETDIFGIIHWPRGFDPRRKYPVVESIYAGPQDSFVPKSFHTSYPQGKLADHGFIVVQIDGMGTSNRSKKFHDVCWQNLGDAGFPDRMLWLKAAAAQFPALDLGRLGIYGTSAGGQSALRALLAHGDFYRAAVADSGCHDNRMDKIWWNEQWMGWPVGPHYGEQSNVTEAHNLQGPLLLMVGELDRNVDPASTMQVVNALIKADKDFELLVVPGAGHGILGSPYGQHRLVDFFTRHLQRRPGPRGEGA